jgi:polyhydroxyalkanoate synthesis repressor PhaR
MIRVIKRYESRKLYDTEESRYVSLEDIVIWVREGQDVRVIDNGSGEDVTSQVLTQIIHEEGKKGTAFLPTDLLHDLVRAGERALSSSLEQVQGKVDRIVKASIDRLGPVRQAREEMDVLRLRLADLEQTLSKIEVDGVDAPTPAAKSTRRSTTAKKPAAKKAAASNSATKKSAAKKPATKKPAAKKPAAPKSVASKPTAKKPAEDKPVADKAAAGKSAN